MTTRETPEQIAQNAITRFVRAVDPTTLDRTVRASKADRSAAHDEAAAQPCSSCPWLKENIGRPHPDSFFDEPEKARYWQSVKSGHAFPCHKTRMDPAFVSPEAAAEGWRATPEHARSKECAGAVELMRREYLLRQGAGSQEAYFDLRGPHGVPESGFAVRLARQRGEVAPPIRVTPSIESKIDVEWLPWPVDGREHPLINPPCDCPVCARHAEVHDQTTLTDAAGNEVEIDTAIAPLVQRLWDRGAVTAGSCQSMNEAIDTLWPKKRQIILSGTTAPDEMNYRQILRKDLAFVRGVSSAPFLDLAQAVRDSAPRLEVAEWGPLIHVAFPLEMVHDLTVAL